MKPETSPENPQRPTGVAVQRVVSRRQYEIVARKITERVCAKWQDIEGRGKQPAGYNTKGDIFHEVMRVFEEGVEI